jgi:hypothetical protein
MPPSIAHLAASLCFFFQHQIYFQQAASTTHERVMTEWQTIVSPYYRNQGTKGRQLYIRWTTRVVEWTMACTLAETASPGDGRRYWPDGKRRCPPWEEKMPALVEMMARWSRWTSRRSVTAQGRKSRRGTTAAAPSRDEEERRVVWEGGPSRASVGYYVGLLLLILPSWNDKLLERVFFWLAI